MKQKHLSSRSRLFRIGSDVGNVVGEVRGGEDAPHSINQGQQSKQDQQEPQQICNYSVLTFLVLNN